jgi:hypothetical protein
VIGKQAQSLTTPGCRFAGMGSDSCLLTAILIPLFGASSIQGFPLDLQPVSSRRKRLNSA